MNLSLSSARDALLAGLFGDAKKADHAQPRFALDMLSDWLPYRVYDEGPGLYCNAHSKGFVLEVTPLIGADERTGEILGQFCIAARQVDGDANPAPVDVTAEDAIR